MNTTIHLLATAVLVAFTTAPAASNPNERLARSLDAIDARYVTTGILYDRVVGLSAIHTLDGTESADPATRARWIQTYFELYRAHLETPAWPPVTTMNKRGIDDGVGGLHPIGLLDLSYNRLRPDVIEDGSLVVDVGGNVAVRRDPVIERRVFAVSALRDVTYRGGDVTFVVPRDLVFSNGPLPNRLLVDFDDGRGARQIQIGERVDVSYARTGHKQVRVQAHFDNGTVRHGAFEFHVRQLLAPAPDDTIHVTASLDYQGQFGSGHAYVYLAPNHTAIVNPIIVVEGLDLDNSKNWDELYGLLNRELLLESLRIQGFDAIVLNFTAGADYVQKNGFVVVELIQHVQNVIWPQTTVAVVGASMGGVCARYALSYMENNGLPHRVRVLLSFDSPQNGADIPLGIQYWFDFFSELSTEAASLLESLDTPAARQLLVYHHTDPPGNTGVADALRPILMNDLAALGGYPSQPRLVAVANGAGNQTDQGFAPRDQIILYDYTGLLVDIRGNAYAVTDGANSVLFDGEIDYLIGEDTSMLVEVTGTLPYDGAPGGSRNSMQQMDQTPAPFGDIIALHQSHCFIPTISALDLNVTDLFFDIAGEPNILALTPFDAVYYGATNEQHVLITPENKVWVESELLFGVTGITPESDRPAPITMLHQNRPNPFNPTTNIHFDLATTSDITLTVHDVTGRLVRTLIDGRVAAGPQQIEWDATNHAGARVGSGVYFYRLRTPNQLQTRKMVVLK